VRNLLRPRPTVYKGIKMRSRLEARFAAYLDNTGDEWVYEPRAYADERGQYLPDFEILCKRCKKPCRFVEVKPTHEAVHAAIPKVAPIFSSLPKARVSIVYPEGDEWHGLVVTAEEFM
jgi:hypothetical protein